VTLHGIQKFKNALVKHVCYVTVCIVGSPVILMVGDFRILSKYFLFCRLLDAASGGKQLDEDS
jgi:hypothetical protein